MNAHSVRKMRVCCICGELGMYSDDAPSAIGTVVCVNPIEERQWQRFTHPRCYIKQHGVAKFVSALPSHELGMVRLSDVSARDMKAILSQLSKEAGAA